MQSRSNVVKKKLSSLSEVENVCKNQCAEEHVPLAHKKNKENLISPIIFKTLCKGGTKKALVNSKVYDFKFRSPSNKRAD